jgi:hypothetical protein
MRKRERATSGTAVVAGCEAFLDGTLAEYWERQGFTVPVWVWTNLLAHGSAAQIADSVVRPPRARRNVRTWRIARSYVATELLEITDGPRLLRAMQSDVLIPLELEMATLPAVRQWTPRQWVDAVDWAIRSQPSRADH